MSQGFSVKEFQSYLKDEVTKVCAEQKLNFDKEKERSRAFNIWIAELYKENNRYIDTDPEDSLLGIEENVGFKQLMTTFENARIQTASRSNGLSKRAFELAFNYSKNRIQFGKSIFAFPRIYQKLQSIFLNLVGCKIYNLNVTTNYNNSIGNQLNSSITKMLCSNYCWINADISFQIHGSYGYAQEFEISRMLCDSRIMSIFEGTSEIQASIIAKQIFKK